MCFFAVLSYYLEKKEKFKIMTSQMHKLNQICFQKLPLMFKIQANLLLEIFNAQK